MNKPHKKVQIKWSANFAYAIGLLVTDGCLSSDGRHIDFTSKDLELINNMQTALHTNLLVSKKNSGSQHEKKYFRIQIGDVVFYRFLEKIGLMKRKSKIIAKIRIPDKYFTDFLRGLFDGDGSFYSYFDPRWKSSFMFYTVFCSASPKHIIWLRGKIQNLFGIKGHISKSPSYQQLKYAKSESLILIKHLYKNKDGLRLERKYLKISEALSKLSPQ